MSPRSRSERSLLLVPLLMVIAMASVWASCFLVTPFRAVSSDDAGTEDGGGDGDADGEVTADADEAADGDVGDPCRDAEPGEGGGS